MVDATDVRALLGHEVVDRDGKSIGYVDQVFSDNQSGEPEWIGVITGGLRRRTHLVPIAGLETGNGTLKVPWTKDRVKDSPQYGSDDKGSILGLGDYRPAISESKEREAYAYYGTAKDR
ncbi:MAG TPA: PRC-barrel domain-containing protein [Gaiellaceae bacterium]|jgi:sporulation protein YlmC with PRC-barrel domain